MSLFEVLKKLKYNPEGLIRMSTEDFPFVLDDFLASVVEALRLWGDARAITTLIQGDCDLRFINSDWGVNYWQPYVGLPGPLYFAMTEDDRRATESVIEEAGKPFLNGTTSDALNSVMIAPSVSKAIEGWREDAVRFIKGGGSDQSGSSSERQHCVTPTSRLAIPFKSGSYFV